MGKKIRRRLLPLAIGLLFLGYAPRADAIERICDVAFENCRVPLVDLIRKETVGIDVAFWFMEDTGLATELINRWQAGVPVRVLMDTEANATYPGNSTSLKMLKDAGIPMREKVSGGILHWKMMLFVGQHTVEFSGANYSREAFMFGVPYADYVDEVVYFTSKPPIINSFKTRYDDVWTTTVGYKNYANITTPLARHHAIYPIDPEMNFAPYDSFRDRSLALYKAEGTRVDAIMYRITDQTHTNTLIAAVKRGVPVRLITEPKQYRDPIRLWHAWNVDRMYMAGRQYPIAGEPGFQVRVRKHRGMNHEKLTVVVGQQTTIFGSSNWTSASAGGTAGSQLEHNLFTTDPTWYSWARDHFERKWNNLGGAEETEAFVPLPPSAPVLTLPASGATGLGTTVALTWLGGYWSHKYDVYLGSSPTTMTRIVSDRELGPSESATDYQTWTVSNLTGNTTYYWKVVGRTMANLAAESAVRSFSTGAGTTTPPPPTPSLPSGWSNADIGAVGAAGSASYSSGIYTVKGSGADVWGAADELHFAYKPLAGNGSVIARVASMTNNASWTKVGVMLRESTAAGSKQAFMIVSPSKGLAFQRRTATGGASTHTAGPMATAPYWVKLTRTGTTIQAFVSTNGTAWTLVGSDTISMTSTILAGLAVSSHVDGTLATATFSNVTVGP